VVWSGFTWLRIGELVGSCECGYEPSGSGAIVSYIRIAVYILHGTKLNKIDDVKYFK
jgi:hypothetical protein